MKVTGWKNSQQGTKESAREAGRKGSVSNKSNNKILVFSKSREERKHPFIIKRWEGPILSQKLKKKKKLFLVLHSFVQI